MSSKQDRIDLQFEAVQRAIVTFSGVKSEDSIHRAAAVSVLHTLTEGLRDAVCEAHKRRKNKPEAAEHIALRAEVENKT